MASHGEKILVLELVTSQALVTAKELSKGNIPRPSQYISTLMLFAVLGGMAAIGDGPASVAAALGAVVLITLVVNEKGVSILGIFKVGTGYKEAKILPFPTTSQPVQSAPTTNLRPGAPAPSSS